MVSNFIMLQNEYDLILIVNQNNKQTVFSCVRIGIQKIASHLFLWHTIDGSSGSAAAMVFLLHIPLAKLISAYL